MENEVTLKQYINLGVISQEKSWQLVYDTVKKNHLEDAILDMKNIELENPCSFNWYMKLMRETNVKLKFTNKEGLAESLRIQSVLDGLNPNRIISISTPKPIVKTQYQRKIEATAKKYKEHITIDGSNVILDMNKLLCQITDISTITTIELAIDEWVNEHGWNYGQFIIMCDALTLDESVINGLSEMIVKFLKEKNMHVVTDIKPEYNDKMTLMIQHFNKGDRSLQQKFNFWKNLPIGRVGVLKKYKDSRKLDSLGRKGDGQEISCRVAIYKGVQTIKGRTKLVFDEYTSDTFYTPDHWYYVHDSNQLSGLNTVRTCADVAEVGFDSDFYGTTYNFVRIEHCNNGTEEVIPRMIGDTPEVFECNLAGKAGIVFDSWSIPYDKTELDKHSYKMLKVKEGKGA